VFFRPIRAKIDFVMVTDPFSFPRFAICSLGLILGNAAFAEPYPVAVEKADPVARWSFDQLPEITGEGDSVSGPESPVFADFPEKNPALKLEKTSRVQIPDEGDDSRFDFRKGDEITIEALVNPATLAGQAYILGKGRTDRPGFARHNQNWAMRLRSVNGKAGINFLFRSAPDEGDGRPAGWHRWTSGDGFSVGTGWHHVAISYRFGDPGSIRGYIDGKAVKGSWDMDGPTTAGPVVDDDEVWIGSAMQGNAGNSFHGALDEIALYRRILPAEELENRFEWTPPPLVIPDPAPGTDVTIFMHGPFSDYGSFQNDPGEPIASWEQDHMGFVRVPRNFDSWGVRQGWGDGVMIRAVAEIELEPGDYEFLVRSRGLSRLWIDGEQILDTPKKRRGGGAHNPVRPLAEVPREGMRRLFMDNHERIADFTSEGGTHTVVYDAMVGGKGLRIEFGEDCVAIAKKGGMFRLLGPTRGPELTDEGWESFAAAQGEALDALDRKTRREADQQGEYWARRHALAKQRLVSDATEGLSIDGLVAKRREEVMASAGNPDSRFHREVRPIFEEHCYRCHGEKEKGGLNLTSRESLLEGGDSEIPAVVPGDAYQSFLIELVGPEAGVDRMPPKGDGLTEAQIASLSRWIEEDGGELEADVVEVGDVAPVIDDLTFLRRIWIDLVGMAPPVEEVRAFTADDSADKRGKMIDRLLEDERWADNWMGYWQDVLAENPNLLKPNLNNTGPFRYWILEALRDNKPMDRFATELIMMRGSAWDGGAAGFSVASQNDVPMAAKAHILGTAFLGVEMKCARCHDSPYHETTQEDLFQMAAMLGRKPIQVPASSSVPKTFFEHAEKGGRESLIEVTLTIGSTVRQEWPFDEFEAEIPDGVLENPKDSRERIAAQITLSRRFAEVLVNRVWSRYIGAGIVEPVHDWEGNNPVDPELLAFLTDEFIRSGYDLEALTRRIVSSDFYQREAVDAPPNLSTDEHFLAGPYRRRMAAEQIVDNAWHVTGRRMDLGRLTMDLEGRLAPHYFMNFGNPEHAWEFTTMANERDRPSLALPEHQAIVDVLLAFGWRNSRQEPTTRREEDPNPLQPGVLANGVMGGWLTRLTDDSELTRACLEAESPEALTERLFLRILTRPPTEKERNDFVALLSEGFEDRVIPEDQVRAKPEEKHFPWVSWSNHLHSEANTIKQKQEELARLGDPPTRYLNGPWRKRAEDAVWALFNSPEMILIP